MNLNKINNQPILRKRQLYAVRRYHPTAGPCSGTAIKLASEKPSTVKQNKKEEPVIQEKLG